MKLFTSILEDGSYREAAYLIIGQMYRPGNEIFVEALIVIYPQWNPYFRNPPS